jgi:hypothetical protein
LPNWPEFDETRLEIAPLVFVSGVNVLITILGDFLPIFGEKIGLFKNPML